MSIFLERASWSCICALEPLCSGVADNAFITRSSLVCRTSSTLLRALVVAGVVRMLAPHGRSRSPPVYERPASCGVRLCDGGIQSARPHPQHDTAAQHLSTATHTQRQRQVQPQLVARNAEKALWPQRSTLASNRHRLNSAMHTVAKTQSESLPSELIHMKQTAHSRRCRRCRHDMTSD